MHRHRVCFAIVCQHGDDVVFKVKGSTVLGKVFDAYEARKGVANGTFRFTFDGSRLHRDSTVDAVCACVLG